MNFSDNIVFAGVMVLAIAAGLLFYLSESSGVTSVKESPVKVTTTVTDSTVSSSTTATTVQTTSTIITVQSPSSSSTTSHTSSTTSSTSSTSTTIESKPKSSYLDRYLGKGYRQAFLDIQFFCPSCAPAVARNIQQEPGVMGKSIGWGQKYAWVIYDPNKVDIERIQELAASSGGAQVINDTEV